MCFSSMDGKREQTVVGFKKGKGFFLNQDARSPQACTCCCAFLAITTTFCPSSPTAAAHCCRLAKERAFFFALLCSLCLLFKMAAATHAASRAAPAVGGGAGAAATAVTQRVPRSVRLAARYPPKRTFDGVRPTQKIIELLRKEQPQTAPQLWVHCKKAGAHHNDRRFRSLILRPGFPNKPYMKKITRTLVNQGKLIARPTVPNH